jgi:SnoaL-like protein
VTSVTTYPHQIDVRRPHMNYWLAAVAGLAAALVALGAWVIVDRHTGGGATEGATTLIDELNTAYSTGDPSAIPSLYASNAVIRSIGVGETYAGVSAIRPLADGSFTVERIAPVTVNGEYATTFVKLTDRVGQRAATSFSVFQIKDGKVVRQWNFVPGKTPPFDNAAMP